MKILVVCSANHPNFDFEKNQAFIYDQILAVNGVNPQILFNTFFIVGKGIKGYLQNLSRLKKEIQSIKPAIVQAHGGIIGFFCCLQRKVPVVCTLHGSDINVSILNVVSIITRLLSKKIIFVSNNLKDKAILEFPKKTSVIPCGVDLKVFYPFAKKRVDTSAKSNILFASAFQVPVKNFELAQLALQKVPNYKIFELKERTRDEVNQLINSVDILLLTSISEGSPQIIKEAMACNCPIVSTDVGDVRWVIGETEGCYICSYDPKEVAEKIELALEFARIKGRTNGRQRIIELGLDNESTARRIVEVYRKVIDHENNRIEN